MTAVHIYVVTCRREKTSCSSNLVRSFECSAKMTNTSLSADDQLTSQLLKISQIAYGWASLLVFIIGTFGNISNIILFIRLESLNTLASSLFLLASFCGSQSVMLTATLSRVIFGLTGFDPLFSSIVICKARWTIGPASGAFSLTCVSLAAVDRYLMVRSHNRVRIALQQARVGIVAACIFWLGFFSVYGVFFKAPTSNSCRLVDPTMIAVMPIVSLIVYSVLPISVLSTLSSLIWHKLGQQPGRYLHGGHRLSDQVTRMIVAQMIVVIVTSFPSAVYSVYTISTRTISKTPLRSSLENLVNTVCVLIGFLTHAIMFYVYLIASSNFRQNARLMLDVVCRRLVLLPARFRVHPQMTFPGN